VSAPVAHAAHLLRRGPTERDPERHTEERDEAGDRRRRRRIRCPKCAWEPRRGDLWGCLCGHAFHTFDTAGRCPACHEQWDHTQCLRCGQWSPHPDWYEQA